MPCLQKGLGSSLGNPSYKCSLSVKHGHWRRAAANQRAKYWARCTNGFARYKAASSIRLKVLIVKTESVTEM